ncbi:MAG TPA: thiamine phosphate synthase [Thermoanaerobaculia bacterium]|nr:thiamine phosphate synthase [Thermoanaerobaculia bacterium]
MHAATLRLPPVYALTDRAASGVADPADLARRLLALGVRALQLREKALPDRELLSAAETIADLARSCRARFVVNDRVDVAKLAGAGVHLGHEDLSAAEARAILGPDGLVGVSTHDPEEARRAFADGVADYVAFGPVFESSTKTSRPARGLEALASAASFRDRPLVAIGGITVDRLDAVWDAGADSAAMIGGLYAGGRLDDNVRAALDRARRRRPGRRVYLVGFMAAGKTTVGRRVAERLGWPFVDLDDEIEKKSGRTVRALFEEFGEKAFRERETTFLAATETLPRAVIATGGGSFPREENRRLAARLGTAVFLDVSLETVRMRLKGKTDRPLFVNEAQLSDLFAARTPFYRMAPVAVRLGGAETIEESADRVLTALDDFERNPIGK